MIVLHLALVKVFRINWKVDGSFLSQINYAQILVLTSVGSTHRPINALDNAFYRHRLQIHSAIRFGMANETTE